MLVGENGIITQAQRADELTTQAQQKEAIELAIASVQAQGTLELDRTKLDTALQSQLGDTAYTLTENRDGSFLLQIAERSYYIDSAGEVITQENMIAIGSAEELETFRDDVNNGNTYEGKYVYLTGDITLNINEEWEPIGVWVDGFSNPDSKPFKGIFDGCGYEIDYMKLGTSNYQAQGFFGGVYGGKIKNLGIGKNCSITGIADKTGAIVGFLYKNAELINCYNSSNINTSTTEVGGIIGTTNLNCKIYNCYNSGNISIDSSIEDNVVIAYIGGIVGNNMNSEIINCYNSGNVNFMGNNVAGIAGQSIHDARIQNCYNIGNLNTNNDSATIVSLSKVDPNGLLNNNYYLNNCLNGTNAKVIIEGVFVKLEEEMKLLAPILGAAFKEDTNSINNGYPILIWQ